MRRFASILLVGFLLTMGGCAANRYPADQSVILKTPHRFALTFERQFGRPGETIMAQMEFTNTGSEALWIPPPEQLTFSCDTDRGAGVVTLPPSQCSGINYRKVSPGQRATYQMKFVVPVLPPGKAEVYVMEERSTRIPFEIK